MQVNNFMLNFKRFFESIDIQADGSIHLSDKVIVYVETGPQYDITYQHPKPETIDEFFDDPRKFSYFSNPSTSGVKTIVDLNTCKTVMAYTEMHHEVYGKKNCPIEFGKDALCATFYKKDKKIMVNYHTFDEGRNISKRPEYNLNKYYCYLKELVKVGLIDGSFTVYDVFNPLLLGEKQNEEGTHHPEEYKVKEILEKFNHAHFIIPAVDAEKIEELQQKELEKNTALASSLVNSERMKKRKEMNPYERWKNTIGDNTRHKGRLI